MYNLDIQKDIQRNFPEIDNSKNNKKATNQPEVKMSSTPYKS